MIINELCTDLEEGGGGEAGLFLSYLFCFVVKDVMLNNSNVIMFCIVVCVNCYIINLIVLLNNITVL